MDFLAMEHPHKAARITWARCPLHVRPAGATTASSTLPEIPCLSSLKTGTVRGSGVVSLSLIMAFHPGTEVPEPLGEPGVMWITLMWGGHRTACIKHVVDRGGEFGDQSVQFLGGHRGWNMKFGV